MTGVHPSQQSVTRLLSTLQEGGDEAALNKLFERVYKELHRRAHQQRRRWKGNYTLNTTALVHEAYLKLVDQEDHSWKNRAHFFAVAAKAMRHILINYARDRQAQKRGGDAPKLSLEGFREMLGRTVAMNEERAEMLVVLDEALEQFEKDHPRASRVVECRFFGGMTIEETAEAVGVSTATVSRDWTLAQAWLYREIKRTLEL